MKKAINVFILLMVKVLNKLGRGNQLKKRILSSKNILENNFKIGKEFKFIQVGANDGVSFDFLYEFVIKRQSKGLVIEPIKEYYDELVKNYKNFTSILKINKAVHPTKKLIAIYKIDKNKSHKYPDWIKGIASLNRNHHKKTNIASDDILSDQVNADSLMNILNNDYKYKMVDLFQIDTEGFDFEVIKMIDFKIFKPSLIKYEFINLELNDIKECEDLIKRNGYFCFNEGGDTICIDLCKIKLY